MLRFTLLAALLLLLPGYAAANSSDSGEPGPSLLHIADTHNRDCDFGYPTTLEINGDGRAVLTLTGNRYSWGISKVMPPCVGVFTGEVKKEDVAALAALFRNPLLEKAAETEPMPPESIFRGLSFSDGNLRLSKVFSHQKHSQETTDLLQDIYARLDDIRTALLMEQPEVGLAVAAGTARRTPKTGAIEVEFFMRNTGRKAVTLTEPLYVGATLSTDSGEQYLELSPLNASAEEAGTVVIPPGKRGPSLWMQGTPAQKNVSFTNVSYDSAFQVLPEGDSQPLRLRYINRQPFSRP